MGNFIGFIEDIGGIIETIGPAVQTVTDLSKNFTGASSNTNSAGDYGYNSGGGGSSTPFYKQPWFIPVAAVAVLLLFGKKIMRMFK